MTSDTEWRLEKKIPLGLIVAIAVQTAGFAYFMGQLSERVQTLERGFSSRDEDVASMARRDSRIDEIFRALKRIESQLEKRGRQ